MCRQDEVDSFVAVLEQCWLDCHPFLRFGQYMENFLSWVNINKEIDPFYVPDDMMVEFLKEYGEICKPCTIIP